MPRDVCLQMVSKFAFSGSQNLKIFLPRRGGASGRRGLAPQGRRGQDFTIYQKAYLFLAPYRSRTRRLTPRAPRASSRVRGNGLAGLLFENDDAAADARPFAHHRGLGQLLRMVYKVRRGAHAHRPVVSAVHSARGAGAPVQATHMAEKGRAHSARSSAPGCSS